jgi:clan AA aspartic protease (TIGR02281 family)
MPGNKAVKLALLAAGVFSFLHFFISGLNADTIYLKNGRSLDGIIKNEDESGVELEVCGGTMKVERSQIERVAKDGPADYNALRQKWEKQKLEAKQKASQRRLEEESKPKKAEFSVDSKGMVLAATLNKKVAASLLLDTGASLVVLRKNIAQKLGIDLRNVQSDLKMQLADGRQVNVKSLVLESIKVQNAEAKNVEAAVILDEETQGSEFYDGLLGMSFLRKFNFKIDQKEKKLILEKL